MKDQELMTTVKRSVSAVHMNVPAEQIVRRGRAIRARRTVPVVAGTLTVAAGAAVAVTTLVPFSPASNGSIKVTFREATDPAGLQRTLRADGVPVSVTFTGQQNPACQPISAPPSEGGGSGSSWGPLTRVMDGPSPDHPQDAFATQYAMVIHPSALPSERWPADLDLGNPGSGGQFPAARGPGKRQRAVHRQVTLSPGTGEIVSSAKGRAGCCAALSRVRQAWLLACGRRP